MSQVCLVNQFKVKACCGTQFNNGRQVKRKYKTIFDLAERFRRAADNRLNAVFLARTLFPWLQADESDTGVLPLSAKAKPVYGKDRFNVRFLFRQVIILNLIEYLLGTHLRRPCRQLNHRHKHPLILFRQEGGRQAQEQYCHAADDDDVNQQIAAGLT